MFISSNCQIQNILEQYYPLEIIDTNGLVQGYERMFSIKEINLN